MGFTTPWALLGLVAAGLPILLHLVRRHQPPEVTFPAVRYLEEATRRELRHFRLRNWLLLAVRTLLIIALVLAAAGARIRRLPLGRHAPVAMVVVVDNSASSATVMGGEPLLDRLRAAADAILSRASLDDRLWLLPADLIPRGGTPGQLRARLADLQPGPERLDLGQALTIARDALRTAGRPGVVVVVSDAQRSALGPGAGSGPVVVAHPDGVPPFNRGFARVIAETPPWGPEGGDLTFSVLATDSQAVPVRLALDGQDRHELLAMPGAPLREHVGPLSVGWRRIVLALPADEFRLDDTREVMVRVAPPPQVSWDSTERFVDAAVRVLIADGRVKSGIGVRVGALGSGASVIEPPEDPSQVEALNRLLAARGSAWRFGAVQSTAASTDSSTMLLQPARLTRRHVLERVAPGGVVLVTADRQPWLVQTGGLVLVGSRLDTTWTDLPLSAAFVPFLDRLLTRSVRGELSPSDGVAGEPMTLPDRITAVRRGDEIVPVEGGSTWVPHRTGGWFLMSGSDTVGAVTVIVDPRESDLTRASTAAIESLWPGAKVTTLDQAADTAFAAVGRGDLRAALLWLAFLCVIAESLLAGRVPLRRRGA